jgi:hypothetical protein
VERSLGETILCLVACQVPDDQRLVSRRGKEHIGTITCQCLEIFGAVTTNFSREVARLVTQPEWPTSSPRMINCSAMIATIDERGVMVVRIDAAESDVVLCSWRQ